MKQQVITPIEVPEAFRVGVMAARRAEEDAQDTASARALGLAHYWQHLLDTGKIGSLREIAAAEGMDLAQVSRIARVAWAEPETVDAMLANGNNAVAEPE